MAQSLLRRMWALPEQEFGSIEAYGKAQRQLASSPLPVDAAILGGALADRLGYAFAAGYTAALRHLVPEVERPACFCVTEAGGGHPRQIHGTVVVHGEFLRLTAKKRWATLAGEGEELLVVASIGWEGERNLLRVVRVPVTTPGVRLTPMPATPFTPEIPHYSVELDVELPASSMLPGDGFLRYVKPFRTVEDAHVSAAATAYLWKEARRQKWPEQPQLLTLLLAFRQIAQLPAEEATTHLALDAAQQQLKPGLWLPGPAAERWQRDEALLAVAAQARQQRLAAALAALA